MEYKRFTHNPDNIEFCSPCYLCKHKDEMPKRNKHKCSMAECDYLKCYEKLSDIEDKIEQGTLIELPYKFGSMLYFIVLNRFGGELSIFSTDLWVYISKYGDDGIGNVVMVMDIEINDIDFDEQIYVVSSYHPTREEAEKRLKELQE